MQNVDGNQVNLHLQICIHNLQQCPFKLYLSNKEKHFVILVFKKVLNSNFLCLTVTWT